MYVEIVIGFRQRYLEEYEKQEKNKMFIKYRKEVTKLEPLDTIIKLIFFLMKMYLNSEKLLSESKG